MGINENNDKFSFSDRLRLTFFACISIVIVCFAVYGLGIALNYLYTNYFGAFCWFIGFIFVFAVVHYVLWGKPE